VILGGLIMSGRVEDQKRRSPCSAIPLLGYSLQVHAEAKEQTNVPFFLRPRILQGPDLNREF
jgi:type II secretory pathway component GspD/PulD (secretin)